MPAPQKQLKPGQPHLSSSLLWEVGLSLAPSLNQQGLRDSQLWGKFLAMSGSLKRTLPANNWAIHQSFLGTRKEVASFCLWHSRARALAEEQPSLRGTRKAGTVRKMSFMQACSWTWVGNLCMLRDKSAMSPTFLLIPTPRDSGWRQYQLTAIGPHEGTS